MQEEPQTQPSTPAPVEPKVAQAVSPAPQAEKPDPPTNPQPPAPVTPNGASHIDRFKNWYKSHKKLSVPLSVLLLVILLGLIPFSRYKLAGLVLSKNYQVKIIDSVTNTGVSGASVSLGSSTAETNASGVATIHAKVGPHKFNFSKKYYSDRSASLTVPILGEKTIPSITLTANGRQVKVSVKNLISKKILSNVDISVAGISAKTDSTGSAIIVLPASATKEQATLSLAGYNDATVDVKISNNSIAENDYTLTPAGKVYFLSKLSGKIDVVKANLDGSGRKTVLAGTGKEDQHNTVLLASRDWKYLALLSLRDGGSQPKIFIINTADDQMLTMDQGNANFTLVGWSGDSFIYSVYRNTYKSWQANREAIKSYDATTGKVRILNQTAASGTSDADFAAESYDPDYYISGSNLIFSKIWLSNTGELSGKQAGIYSIGVDGTNFRTLETFGYVPPSSSGNYIQIASVLSKPNLIYFQVYKSGQTSATYYKTDGVTATADATIASAFSDLTSGDIPTYLLSPSAQQSFWSDTRDGKQVLFVGDATAGGAKQIATLSDYNTYGWFTDDYLLVSKNSSELYIIPASGISKDQDALKITDYHKPVNSYYGYGGGYGGL